MITTVQAPALTLVPAIPYPRPIIGPGNRVIGYEVVGLSEEEQAWVDREQPPLGDIPRIITEARRYEAQLAGDFR